MAKVHAFYRQTISHTGISKSVTSVFYPFPLLRESHRHRERTRFSLDLCLEGNSSTGDREAEEGEPPFRCWPLCTQSISSLGSPRSPLHCFPWALLENLSVVPVFQISLSRWHSTLLSWGWGGFVCPSFPLHSGC